MSGRPPGRRPSIPHVPALDGLRGLAVAAVLLHHADHLTGGWLGVDLFFALSGYLITALLLVDHARSDERRIDLRRFWSGRVRRLGPALIITLVGVGVYAATIAAPTDRGAIRSDGLATLFEVANWRTIAVGGDYWATTLAPSPLRHAWSLAIEEQLYVVWPLVIVAVLAWRRRPAAVLAVALVGAFASAALLVGLHAVGVSRARLYYGTDTRASTLLLGAAVAALRVHLGRERWAATRVHRQRLGLAAAGLAVAWVALDGSGSLPYQGALPLAGVAAAAVVAAVADRHHPGPLGRILAVRPLRELGLVSYGVYLYHWPLYLVLTPGRVGLDGWALTAVRIAVSLALAWGSFHLVERPLRTGGPVGRPARAAVPAAAAVAVLALLVGTYDAVDPVRTDDVDAALVRSSVPGAPTVLLAGDSVPLLLGVALADQVDELGVSVVNNAAPGCHLLAGDGAVRGVEGDVRTDVADCAAGGAYRASVGTHRPDLAIVLFGEFPNQAVELDGRFRMPCDPAYLDALRLRLDDLVDDLRASGAPVVLATAPGSSISWVLERVPSGMAERVACTNSLLDRVADGRDGVAVVDLASFVCPEPDRCLEEVDGIDLRPDALHFTGPSAELVNRWLVPRALAAAAAVR